MTEGWFTEESHNQVLGCSRVWRNDFKGVYSTVCDSLMDIVFYLFFKAMRFGDLPPWATELSKLIVKAVLWGNLDMVSSDSEDMISIFPSALLRREPLFDQLIVNLYQPGEVGFLFLRL